MDKKYHRILIVRTDRIGDVILTLPMAQVLRRHFPQGHIAMLIQRYTTELVEDNQNVDQILYYDDGDRPLPFFLLVAMLRANQFDIVFHTHPRFRLALVTWLAGIPVRVGTGYRWYSFFFNNRVYEHRKDARRHELEYNLRLLDAIGCTPELNQTSPTLEVRPEILDRVRNLVRSLGIQQNQSLVILHPGSGRSARDWSAENFGVLARKLGGLPDVKVVIAGGDTERELVDAVMRGAGPAAVSIVGMLSLREYAALSKLATLFIANSTGPIHIAAAVGTRVIGLYPQVTPLNATRWGPYTDKKTIFSPIGKAVDCVKCIRSSNHQCECMDSISVKEVYEAASKILLKDSVERMV